MVNKTDQVSVLMEPRGQWVIDGRLPDVVAPAQGTFNLPFKCQMSQDIPEG